ncbi:hypothetical protein ACFQY0_01075 [Haloferula chungangensis]|uniref:Uncharacterized protein n=1 Tax=Haloferula chungangensis TaxID=1048331 RepID=A0ABW2L3L9_9BACT
MTKISKTRVIPNVQLESFDPSAADKKRITDAITELARLDGILAEITDLREFLDSAGARFAAGELTMAEAVSTLAVSANSTDRGLLQSALRTPIKRAIKTTIADVADVLDAFHDDKEAQLKTKCADLEAIERQSAEEVGIHADEFAPSDTLCRLRESFKRCKANRGCGREALHNVARELGIDV